MFTCKICGQELSEKREVATCTYCGAVEEADYICPAGHYICEDCRLATQSEITERVCLRSIITDPVEMANLIMKHPSFNQYGVEHHELVAPVVLASIRNLGLASISEGRLKAAIKRSGRIPYGSCGTTGTCGAAVSAGVAIGILTGSNYMKDRERNLTLLTTSKALTAVTMLGGPRCCKYSTYVSIAAAWKTAREDLKFNLPILKVRCGFQGRLKDCHLNHCQYYEQ